MKDKISQFEDCFKDLGGRFDYTTLVYPQIFENLINSCRNDIESLRKNKEDLPEVYLDFISNTSLNARASKTSDGYFIGINIGTFFILSDVFFRMLSNKKIISEYGDISKEGEVKKIFNAQITSIETLFLAKEPNEDIAPKDLTRHYLAQLMTSFVIKFLVMHEYEHIIGGHLDYLESKTKSFRWNEINKSGEIENLDPLVSQTLEMDADSFATNKGLEHIIHYTENVADIRNEEVKKFFSSIESSFSLWLFSIYTLFRIFGYYNKNRNKIKTSFHPQSGIRQHLLFATAYTVFQSKKYDKLVEKMPETVFKIMQSVEHAFKEISFQEYDDDAIRIAYESESQEHCSFLIKNWNSVRPLLEKFAKGNLAPIHKA